MSPPASEVSLKIAVSEGLRWPYAYQNASSAAMLPSPSRSGLNAVRAPYGSCPNWADNQSQANFMNCPSGSRYAAPPALAQLTLVFLAGLLASSPALNPA